MKGKEGKKPVVLHGLELIPRMLQKSSTVEPLQTIATPELLFFDVPADSLHIHSFFRLSSTATSL